MKKNSLQTLLLILLISCANPVEYRKNVAAVLLPKPVQLQQQKGYFSLNKHTVIVAAKNLKNEALYLQHLLSESSKFTTKIIYDFKPDKEENVIFLTDTFNFNDEFESEESYKLLITKKNIEIAASTTTGVMRGIQTLRQLFINDFYKKLKRSSWQLPQLQITDKPAFKHRGILFDSGRHFFSTNVVKKYIDLLAFYKMNVFHWHLTEDQGWRIAIDKYPKLTEIGAYRIQKDSTVYGGFYTKEAIKSIVAYAKERHITVIPEIEMPGHSTAAIAAYPELSCTGDTIQVASEWGIFKDVYCAGNEDTFTFLENVLLEVMDLFPSEYIHIGGDEAPKDRWKDCSKCQKRIKEEGLKDEKELQSYFIKRIEKFLAKHNKKLIGWDEILQGGLSPTATVQSWRGEKGGIVAATNSQYAIMSPRAYCYFDYDILNTDLEKVYNFKPIPSELPITQQKFILGSEGNLWSERIPDENTLDAKAFPRILALSEVLWTAPVTPNFNTFYQRVQNQYPVLKNKGVNYGLEFIPVKIENELKEDKVAIKIIPKFEDFKAMYRWNCEKCDTVFKPIPKSITLSKSAELEISVTKNNVKYGTNLKQSYSLHKAIGAKVNYKTAYNSYYKASGDDALVNGRLASNKYRDTNWQGFLGADVNCVIDLQEATTVSTIGARFLHKQKSWILAPSWVSIEVSLDGNSWENWAKIEATVDEKSEQSTIEVYSKQHLPKTIRYIKLFAKNVEKLPEWHEGSGKKGWLFIDEIFVR
ncbi:glycoside hydrolase family 20 protein [Lutibacter sp.]